MASIAWSLERIKNDLTQLLEPRVIRQVCRDNGYRWRERVLGPVQTVHLFILQLLAGMSMAGVRHPAQMKFTASALCQAKARLPLKVLRELLKRVAQSLAGTSKRSWMGLKVFVADGTGLLLADTPQLRKKFGKPSGQKPGCGLPVVKWVALLDVHSGALIKAIPLPLCRQEMTVVQRLAKCMGKGALLLADRGFAGFAHVAVLTGAQIRCCLRLPKQLQVVGRGKGRLKWLKKLGKGDCLVSWQRPVKRVRWMSRRAWNALPAQMMLRQVSFRVRRKGYRTRSVVLLTTLLEADRFPRQKLAELYAARWQVEVCLRDMKQTMGLEALRARTIQGIQKELLAFALAYNLVRLVMVQAAAAAKVSPDRISFIDALRWVLWSVPGQEPDLLVNAKRGGRCEPRVVKRIKNDFPRMSTPREELRKTLPARSKRRRLS
jgi:hypothetical protein